MRNFSSEICPDWSESMYSQECLQILLPDSPIYYDLLHYMYNFAWLSDFFREFATLLLIFHNKHTDGISCKALMMYLLASILRFSSEMELNEWIFFCPKYTYLVLAFGLLLVAFTLRSREDEEDDTESPLLLVLGCVTVSLMRGEQRLGPALLQLSLILESAALIPQLSMNRKKRTMTPTAGFFITSWFLGKLLMGMYYIILAYLSAYRFNVTHDVGFHQFGCRSFFNSTAIMLGVTVGMQQLWSLHWMYTQSLINHMKVHHDRSSYKQVELVIQKSETECVKV